MKTIYIVHGWDGSSKDDWIGWAAEAFRGKGYKVVAPDMPNTQRPEIDAWVNYLIAIVEEVNEDTYFIGHSIGCQAIMRYLESQGKKAGGAIFVAGWFDLTNLEDIKSEQTAKPWIKSPIRTDLLKNNLAYSVVILGDDDHWVPYVQTKEAFESRLGSEVITLTGAGHITADSGFGPFPKLIEVFESHLKK